MTKQKVCPDCKFRMISLTSRTCSPCRGIRDAANRDPSPEEIQEKIQELKDGWDEREEMRRRFDCYKSKPVELEPVILLSILEQRLGEGSPGTGMHIKK